jgi:hypothetical protein
MDEDEETGTVRKQTGTVREQTGAMDEETGVVREQTGAVEYLKQANKHISDGRVFQPKPSSLSYDSLLKCQSELIGYARKSQKSWDNQMGRKRTKINAFVLTLHHLVFVIIPSFDEKNSPVNFCGDDWEFLCALCKDPFLMGMSFVKCVLQLILFSAKLDDENDLQPCIIRLIRTTTMNRLRKYEEGLVYHLAPLWEKLLRLPSQVKSFINSLRSDQLFREAFMFISECPAHVKFHFNYDSLQCSTEVIPSTVRCMDNIRFTKEQYDEDVHIFSYLHRTYGGEYGKRLDRVRERGETLNVKTLCSIFKCTYKLPSTTPTTALPLVGDKTMPKPLSFAGNATLTETLPEPVVSAMPIARKRIKSDKPAVSITAKRINSDEPAVPVTGKHNWTRYVFVYMFLCDE